EQPGNAVRVQHFGAIQDDMVREDVQGALAGPPDADDVMETRVVKVGSLYPNLLTRIPLEPVIRLVLPIQRRSRLPGEWPRQRMCIGVRATGRRQAHEQQ